MKDRVKAMAKHLETWLTQTGALLPVKNPNWNGRVTKAEADEAEGSE